jgi:ribosomal protein S18 acetylase RimI-like enzyme
MKVSSSSAFQPGAELPELVARVHSSGVRVDAPVTFRERVSSAEIEEIRDLHSEWFPVNYADDFFDSLTNSPDVVTVVAEIDSRIVGMATVASRRNERRFNPACDLGLGDNVSYILTLGVIDELRRKGVATKLLKETEVVIKERDPECGVVFLHVIGYNHAAIWMYEKNGFRWFKTEPNFYRLGEDWYAGELYFKPLTTKARLSRIMEWFTKKIASLVSRMFAVKVDHPVNSMLETV